MTDSPVTIRMAGKVAYNDEISVAQAAQIIAFLNSADAAAFSDATFLGGSSLSRPTSKKVDSARDALDVSGALKNPEKIVALAAYVMQDGGETFKVEDVKAAFRRARETAPANFPRDLDKAIGSGWIGDAGGGEYFLTSKVDGVLDGGFTFAKTSSGSRARTGVRRSPAVTGSKPRGKKPDVFAQIDEFPMTMDGYPPYSKMKQNKDKLLWVVCFAKGQGIGGLTNKDIEWLTDHLNAGIPNRQISQAFNSAQKPGYANKSTQDGTIRITDQGEIYIASIGAPTPAS